MEWQPIYQTFLRLSLAALLGALVGFEREKKGHQAGLRTHMLVCMGSALIMDISLFLQRTYDGGIALDPTRIAAGVVTGIGFLGGGAIIKSGESARGLTTAASIWVMAAIGLAVGCGNLTGALVGAFITVFILSVLKLLEK